MQLGSLEIQIFVSLVVVLGTAFVALVCDFLKGNNEQLRERNVELRVRQDEREKLGLTQPGQWLQSLAAMVRGPQPAQSMAGGAPAPAARAAADRPADRFVRRSSLEATVRPSTAAVEEHPAAPVRKAPPAAAYAAPPVSAPPSVSAPMVSVPPISVPEVTARVEPASTGSRRRYEEQRAQSGTSWASQEEMEQLAARAGRIRARHEAAMRRQQMTVASTPVVDEEPVAAAAIPPAPVVSEAPVPEARMVEPKPVQMPVEMVAAEPPPAELKLTEPVRPLDQAKLAEPTRIKVLPIDLASERFDAREHLDLMQELNRVASLNVDVVEEAHRPGDGRQAVEEPAAAGPTAERSSNVMPEPASPAEVAASAEIAAPVEVAFQEAEPETEPVSIWREGVSWDAPTAPAAEVASDREGYFVSSLREGDEALAPEVVTPAGQPAVAEPAAAISQPEPVAAAPEQPPAVADLAIPAGLHDATVFSTLLESQAPYTGVVVAIGINDYESLRDKLMSPAGNDSLEALQRMVLSMLRQHDFACRFQEDEFLLLFPGETSSSAQRRLFQVSEKLWDFQLRSLGHLSVMFSWGGLDVHGETLAEAVASARERMFQTKRSRKPTPMDLSLLKKRVVNG